MTEKRSTERKCLIYYLQVSDRNTNEFLGYLLDITIKGALILSESPIELNTVFQLKLELTDDDQDPVEIVFDAICVRCYQEDNPAFYFNGLCFEKINPDNVDEIKKLISRYGMEG